MQMFTRKRTSVLIPPINSGQYCTVLDVVDIIMWTVIMLLLWCHHVDKFWKGNEGSKSGQDVVFIIHNSVVSFEYLRPYSSFHLCSCGNQTFAQMPTCIICYLHALLFLTLPLPHPQENPGLRLLCGTNWAQLTLINGHKCVLRIWILTPSLYVKDNLQRLLMSSSLFW